MYRVKDFYDQFKDTLELSLVGSDQGLGRRILLPEAHRPGLSLSGYLKSHAAKRILVFGKVEVEYLRHLDPSTRVERLDAMFWGPTPCVIIARRFRCPKELYSICQKKGIPILRTPMKTMTLLSKLTLLLTDAFAQTLNCHGTLVEVFGVGVLIQGDSSVGKSEAALGLIERGHRLIADDLVKIKKRGDSFLEGSGAELTRHHMEIRGIGIINVANLYGAVCIRNDKQVDLVVKLENWDDKSFYDRVGLDEKYCQILGTRLPFHVLPVKPGRDVVLLLETIALNHRLKGMGYHSAKECSTKLLETINQKQEEEARDDREYQYR